MKSLLGRFKSKSGYITGLVIAMVLGGLTTAVVMAAIPDGSGVIHGCRSKLSGGLRVIDSASQQCLASETSLNWSQTGPQGPAGTDAPVAIGYINTDGTLNTSHLKGVVAYQPADTDISNTPGYCLKLSFVPTIGLNSIPSPGSIVINNLDQTQVEEFGQHCGSHPDYNAFVVTIPGQITGFVIH